MILPLIAYGLLLVAQGTPESLRLHPGATVHGSVTNTTTSFYQVTLAAGEFVELVLDQGGIDLAINLVHPDGTSLRIDARENGLEAIFIAADHEGVYKLEIQPTQKLLEAALYRVTFLQVRPREPDDTARLEAQQLSSEAKQLASEGSRVNLRQAVDRSSEALKIWRRLGNPRQEAVALSQLGAFRFLLSEFEEAKKCFLQALSLTQSESEPEPWLKGESLNDLGLVLWQLGEFTEAIQRLSEALNIWQKLGHRYGQAATLSNLGILHRETGSYQKSRAYYRQALAIIISLHDRAHEAYVWSNLGVVLHALSEDRQSLASFRRAVNLFRTAGNHSAEGRSLLHVARIYLAAHDLAMARKYTDRAQLLLQAAGDDRSLGDAWNLTGEILASRDKQKALEYHKKALEIFHRISNPDAEASALHDIGVLYSNSGDPELGSQYLTRAYTIRHSLGNRDGEANSLFQLAIAERALGRLDDAQSHMEPAIELTESLRALVAGPHARMLLLASKDEYFSFMSDLYLELDRSHPGQGFAARALEIIERGRARSLLDLLGEARMGILRAVRPDLVRHELRLREALDFWSVRLTEASTHDNRAKQEYAAKQVEGLLGNYHDLESEIRVADPRYALLVPRPLSLLEIQQQILDPDTILLEYALGGKHSNLWVATPHSLFVFQLPSSRTIDQAVQRLYRELLQLANRRSAGSKDEEQFSRVAASLSRILLSPASTLITGKRLVIVGNDALQKVPFAVLPDPGSGRPLLEGHEISFLPSASVLAAERQALRTRKPASQVLAAIADPVFDAGDARTDKPVSGVTPVFPRLPHSRIEADAMLKFVPPDKSLRAVDFAADRDLFLSGKMAQYKIIHVGTHAVIDTGRPELSALVFSLVDRNGSPRNGYLRLHEIASLKLSASVVTLSGCSTGLGKPIPGEGVVGFARGFAGAGVPTVIVSLWNVEDEATAHFMGLFYQAMLVGHFHPAAALRQAQAAMSKEKRWNAYHWGGWLVTGEWR